MITAYSSKAFAPSAQNSQVLARTCIQTRSKLFRILYCGATHRGKAGLITVTKVLLEYLLGNQDLHNVWDLNLSVGGQLQGFLTEWQILNDVRASNECQSNSSMSKLVN